MHVSTEDRRRPHITTVLRVLAGWLIVLALLASAQRSTRTLPATELTGGGFNVAQGHSLRHGRGPLKRFIVEVEDSLNIRAIRFARKVQKVLFDRRSWIRSRTFSLRRVESEPAAFRVTLATRSTTDRLCAPLPTNGSYSCWNGSRVCHQRLAVEERRHILRRSSQRIPAVSHQPRGRTRPRSLAPELPPTGGEGPRHAPADDRASGMPAEPVAETLRASLTIGRCSRALRPARKPVR